MRKIFFALLFFVSAASAQTYQPTWESLDTRPVPQWYKDVKFGIFIHWGVYAVPAFGVKGTYSEWYQHAMNSGDTATINYHKKKFGDKTYYQLADNFKAELFNPDEWAQVFEKSGAKYIVLTSKHHDGFANWPSKEASRDWGFPWNAAETGPHRDLLGDLFMAVRKTSVHAGMYYSLYEWYNPLWLKDRKNYVDLHMLPQIKELINTYKPDVFWTDGDWDASDSLWKSKEILAWMYNESPVKDKVVTYDRWGGGIRFHHGGVYTPEYQPDVDFEDHYWEESRGMGFSYGYNREEDAWDYNSAQSLVLQLIDKVSRGGNFLLDIGPDEHGKIPPIMQERLLQIGDWLKINGEAIYNTRRWRTASQWSDGKKDYKPKDGGGDILLKLTVNPDPGYAVKECFFTYNPTANNLYAILPQWPSNGKFIIHDLPLKADTKIELLETHEALQWKQDGNNVTIQLPGFDPNKIKGKYAYVLKLSNTGTFAAKPKIDVSYPNHATKPVINITANDGSEIYYTLDGSVPTKNSRHYTKPFTANSSATLSVRAFKNDVLPGNISTTTIHVYDWKKNINPGNVQQGLQLKKFILQSPRSTDELENAVADKTITASSISVNDTLRRENSGLIYDGFIKIPADGMYIFYLSSDDGSKLLIDKETVIDNDGLHGGDEANGKIALKKGYHTIKLSYFQATGGAELQLLYGLEGREKKKIPAVFFYH
jgi:alpha-L-fucosidase